MKYPHFEIQQLAINTFVTLNLGGIDVVSRLRGDVSLQSGEQASFVVNMDKVVLFDPVTEKRLNI